MDVAKQRSNSSRVLILVENGRSLLDAGDVGAAVRDLREAAEIGPESEEAHLYLGIALRRGEQDLAGAFASLKQVLRLNPQRAEAHYQLGLTLRDSERPAEALAALRRAVDLAPSLVEAQRALGDLALELGDRETAMAAFGAVLAWDPGDAEIRRLLQSTETQSE